MEQMIQKEMKYNLHYGDVREDVLPPPHGTNTSCSCKINVKKDCFWLHVNVVLRVRMLNTTFSSVID